jgi:hypothetical protein
VVGTCVAETILASAQLSANKSRTYGSKRSDQNTATQPCEEGVVHIWGSALTHHPHLHCIIPGGGLSLDGERWISCRKGFFLPVRVLSRLFRRLFLDRLATAHAEGRLVFFGHLSPLAERAVTIRPLSATLHRRRRPCVTSTRLQAVEVLIGSISVSHASDFLLI